MRPAVLILMIVLLPLRSWAGDAMSVAMAIGHATRAAAAAMPADCPMHASSGAVEANDSGVGHASPTPQACDVCDLCLPFTDLVPPVFAPGSVGTQDANAGVSTGHLSADQARDLRPPIL